MMKRVLNGVFAMAFSVAAQAQVAAPLVPPKKDSFSGPTPVPMLPAASNGLGFEARLVSVTKGAGKANPLEGKTTHESKSLLEVRIRNLSSAPAEAHLEWYFVARDLVSKKNYVWDRGQRDLSLSSGAERVEMVESSELARSTTKTYDVHTAATASGQTAANVTSSTRDGGSRPYGWVMRMWVGDRLIQLRASSSEFEMAGRSYARVR